jgi:predicted phosphodiesterase
LIILNQELPIDHDIYIISDTHEGTILKYHDGLNGVIEKVKSNKNSYLVHLGDLAEAITVDDWRYSLDVVDMRSKVPLLQYTNATEELMPIKEKILTILLGNHDWTLSRYGDSVKDLVCKMLGVPYGTYTCKLQIRDKRRKKIMYKMFLTHGFGFINSMADDPIRQESNRKLSLKRKLNKKAGDCLIMAMGHTHQLLVADPIQTLYLVDDGKKVHQKYIKEATGKESYIHPDLRWYVNSGSFLKLYKEGVSGYGERMGLDPIELGHCLVKVRDGKVASVEKVVA